jgi:hypothetical protein
MKHSDAAKDKKLMSKVAKTEVKRHEKAMHGYAKGGKTNLDMKKYGRGMAKVMNQRSSGRGR